MPLNLDSLVAPISLVPAVTLTDEELMHFSQENRPYKIERTREGNITIMTPVGYTGGTHEIEVASALLTWSKLDGRGSAVGAGPGFKLPDGSVLSPDAAWTAFERLHMLSAEQRAGFLPLCPDFIIEIRSRSDSRLVLEAKMQLWLDNGVHLGWLVDPIASEVIIYQHNMQPRTLRRPDVVVATSPIAGFVLACDSLWSLQ